MNGVCLGLMQVDDRVRESVANGATVSSICSLLLVLVLDESGLSELSCDGSCHALGLGRNTV